VGKTVKKGRMIREPTIKCLDTNPKHYQMTQSEEVRQNRKTPANAKTDKNNRWMREARAWKMQKGKRW
jgi:hypothetical protein